MSDTFWVSNPDGGSVLITRDGLAGVDPDERWVWSWSRPSHSDVEHLVQFNHQNNQWVRGMRVSPGGWNDEPMPWRVPTDHQDAEQMVISIVQREPS